MLLYFSQVFNKLQKDFFYFSLKYFFLRYFTFFFSDVYFLSKVKYQK